MFDHENVTYLLIFFLKKKNLLDYFHLKFMLSVKRIHLLILKLYQLKMVYFIKIITL